MRQHATILLLIVLALPALAGAAEPPPPEEAPFAPSQALASLLAARGSDGEAVLGPDELEYFDGLPTRAKRLFDDAAADDRISAPSHLKELLALRLGASKIELLMQDNCVVCHSDPDAQDSETLFSTDPDAVGSPSHMNLEEFVSDAHFRRGLSCAGCHGGSPDDDDMSDEIYTRMPEAPERYRDRTWIPDFCARCHADPTFMRRFDPGIATDQYAKYQQSRHGRLVLGKGDSNAAQCVSCHGVHGIRGPRSPRSRVYPKQVPYTCGHCHADRDHMAGYLGRDGKPLPTDQLQQFETSVHGRALLERGDLGAPACNDCHGNHAAMPPEVSSVSQVCRTCHAQNGELFDGSKHKKAFEREGWPECEKCHGNHAIAKASDSMLSEPSSSLCYECHREYAKDNPDCTRTAKYFYASITDVDHDTDELREEIEILAEKGLDVEPLSQTVDELDDVLRQMRSRIHAFNLGEFQKVEDGGRQQIEKGRELVAKAYGEYRFRRNGLIVAVGVMTLLAIVIYLKLREIESR